MLEDPSPCDSPRHSLLLVRDGFLPHLLEVLVRRRRRLIDRGSSVGTSGLDGRGSSTVHGGFRTSPVAATTADIGKRISARERGFIGDRLSAFQLSLVHLREASLGGIVSSGVRGARAIATRGGLSVGILRPVQGVGIIILSSGRGSRRESIVKKFVECFPGLY